MTYIVIWHYKNKTELNWKPTGGVAVAATVLCSVSFLQSSGFIVWLSLLFFFSGPIGVFFSLMSPLPFFTWSSWPPHSEQLVTMVTTCLKKVRSSWTFGMKMGELTNLHSVWLLAMFRLRHLLILLIVHLLCLSACWSQISSQFDICRSLRNSEAGPGWEFYACQPPPTNMKEFMQIRVDPPGITCGNPPERFCTLVSLIHPTHTWSNRWPTSSCVTVFRPHFHTDLIHFSV